MKFGLLAILLILATGLSLAVGSVTLSVEELFQVMTSKGDSRLVTIVLDIRLPRSLLAVLVGAGIATAGAAIQGLFRNPLADPALIGVSAGAALFAALFIVVGGSQDIALLGMTGSAFVGGLVVTWIVLLVGQRGGGLSTLSLIHI